MTMHESETADDGASSPHPADGQAAAVRWLRSRLQPERGSRFLDVDGGDGGAATWLAAETGCLPVTGEQEAGTGALENAWMLDVLAVNPDPHLLMAEMARMLRPGGGLGVYEHVRRRLLTDPPPGHRYFSLLELCAALTCAGFDVWEIEESVDLAPAPDLPVGPGQEHDVGRRRRDQLREGGDLAGVVLHATRAF